MRSTPFALAVCMSLSTGLVLSSARAEVIVTLHAEALVPDTERTRPEGIAELPAGQASVRSGIGVPSSAWHFAIWYEVDTMNPADSTLWAVRNERTSVDVMITVEYFDVKFKLQKTEVFTIKPHGVKTRNVRDVVGLAVDPDGFARGFVRVMPDGAISMDSFQVDFNNNFATGGVAFAASEGCKNWSVRFLRFFAGAGTFLNILSGGPLGIGGDPTLVGNVYNEAGDFMNSFAVRTDDYAFKLAVHDFVVGGLDFGSVELVFDTTRASDHGWVAVGHPALGRFSIGSRGICTDPPSP